MSRSPQPLDANKVRQAFEHAIHHGLAGVPRVHPGALARNAAGSYMLYSVQSAWLGYLERASEQHARAHGPFTEDDRAEVRAALIRNIVCGHASDDDSIDTLIRSILSHFAS